MKSLKKTTLITTMLGLSTSFILSSTNAAATDYSYLKGIEGDLITYCGAESAACAVVIDEFNQKVAEVNSNNKFEAKFIRLSTSEMMSRIKGELEKSTRAADRKCKSLADAALENCKEEVYKSKVDIAFYGTDDPYKTALQDDLFAKHKYPLNESIQPWASSITLESDNRLGGLYMGVLGLGVNTELLQKLGLPKPMCWKDLEKPEYKNQIVVANWNTSGTAYKFAATLLQAFDGDQDKGWDAVTKIHQNVSQYTKSGSKGVKMAASGETLIGIGFGHDIVDLIDQGFPIELVIPCEGTLYEIGPVGIVRGAPHRAAAEAFTTFLYEKDTQELLATVGSLQFPSNSEAAAPKGSEGLKDAKLIVSDSRYATKSFKNDIIQKWTNEIFPLSR
jgi:iron(III) transport system substrate-binding protein